MAAPTIPPSSPLEAARPIFADSYKRLVLSLLLGAYTLNFIDRTIIATIGQAIKVDLKISDAQLGLLGGLYFALLYTLLGIPIARFAERASRVNIIAGSILVWSAFTALCGTAGNFAALSLFRFGVGFGEAGLSPPAHSIISDYYEPRRRASALAVYSFGIPLGTMFGAVAGGWLAQNFSWRVAFMVVGLPGVLIAIAIKALMKEPPRGHSEPVRADLGSPTPAALKPARGLAGEFAEIGAVFRALFTRWPVANMMIGVTLVSFGGYGAGQFVPPYFIRAFGLNYAQVGLIVGLVGGLSSGAGTLAGGFLTDRLARYSARWYALTPAIGVALSFPFLVAIYTAQSWPVAVAFLLVPGLLSYVYLGPTFGVVQNMVSTRQRATATALMFFVLNLIALGGGPPFTGWLIDQFAAFHFAHPGSSGLGSALASLFQGGLTPFRTTCPGGLAPKGAGAAAAAACHGALVLATRHGVISAYAFGLWGAFHYLLGSFGLKEALEAARKEREAAA
jgi:predicted MFS family arabinose efflux permease